MSFFYAEKQHHCTFPCHRLFSCTKMAVAFQVSPAAIPWYFLSGWGYCNRDCQPWWITDYDNAWSPIYPGNIARYNDHQPTMVLAMEHHPFINGVPLKKKCIMIFPVPSRHNKIHIIAHIFIDRDSMPVLHGCCCSAAWVSKYCGSWVVLPQLTETNDCMVLVRLDSNGQDKQKTKNTHWWF